MSSPDLESRPAKILQGKELAGGWNVLRRIDRKPNATGGHFSTGYEVVHNDGRRGFLKALDYYEAFQSEDTARVLNGLTQAFNFERDLCLKCKASALSNVVHPIEHGELKASPLDPFSKVSYLIFEMADGDIRHHLDAQDEFDAAFVLRALHHVAVGLNQLHGVDVAHQDLKPSNVLVFEREGVSKIADLGRAWSDGMPAPHDMFLVAGDVAYSPPELRFSHLDPDQRRRRFGCDMYHLGSLVTFLFTRVHINALLRKHLNNMIITGDKGWTFTEALPYLQAAFGESLREFSDQTPELVRSDLDAIVSQLCEPDPAKRGHPLNRSNNQFSLERYVSWFKLLAHRLEAAFFKGSR
jgi:serine/threonine protein kinase